MSTSDFCFRTTARSLRKRIEKILAMWEVGSIKQQKDDKSNRQSLISYYCLQSTLVFFVNHIHCRQSTAARTHPLSL